MPAIRMDGTVEYEGQVLEYDIDQDGIQAWQLGEMYFTIAKNKRMQGCETMVCDYERIYVNQPQVANVDQNDYRNVNINMWRVYKDVIPDVGPSMLELYEHIRKGEREFRKTLIKYGTCTDVRFKRDVRIKHGPNRGKVGFVLTPDAREGLSPRQETWLLNPERLVTIQGEEEYTTKEKNLEVLVPLQNITGTVACLDCHNIYQHKEFAGMVWVTCESKHPYTDEVTKYNRPICGLCIDALMEQNKLNMERGCWSNLTGPYEYTEDQPASRFDEPSMRPLHRVLFEQRGLRIGQTGRGSVRTRRAW